MSLHNDISRMVASYCPWILSLYFVILVLLLSVYVLGIPQSCGAQRDRLSSGAWLYIQPLLLITYSPGAAHLAFLCFKYLI